jgi:hypothetical protein
LYKPTKTAFSQVFRLFILIARKFFVRGVQRFYQFEVKKSPAVLPYHRLTGTRGLRQQDALPVRKHAKSPLFTHEQRTFSIK